MSLDKLVSQDAIKKLKQISQQDERGNYIVSDNELLQTKKELQSVLGISNEFSSENFLIAPEGKSAIRQENGFETVHTALVIPFGGAHKLDRYEHRGEIQMILGVSNQNQAHVSFLKNNHDIVTMRLEIAKQVFALLNENIKNGRALWVFGPVSAHAEQDLQNNNFSILTVAQESTGSFVCHLTNLEGQTKNIPVLATDTSYFNKKVKDRGDIVIKFMIPEWSNQTPHVITNMWGPELDEKSRGTVIWCPQTVDKFRPETFPTIDNLIMVPHLQDRRRYDLVAEVDLTFSVSEV